MSTRMLIDSRHPEETRVTVVKGSRVEEFDYESASKRPLKGNIYLARVTRVEPSLQAAFVEYGGNRHGFLAFSEIHPDYYQIPVEDRRDILEAETKAALERAREIDEAIEKEAAEGSSADEADLEVSDADDNDADSTDTHDGDEAIEAVEGDEAEKDAEIAEAAAQRQALRQLKRRYNIQEVIKRRQVLLVQVVKEERGNKGAALTTYLSLAGRYCVLMPNSTHAGGISRKISNAADRRSLKKMIASFEVPKEMGLIVRTAGMERTKTEIKRDYEYLLRLWSGIRELTLQSVAPTLVYEEGNLIKRTIRDLYTRDIDEILVEGENGYRAAKEFMKLLMPSHAKKVQHYKDPIPLFHRYQVENHLEAMYQPVVQLRSGGYIVINPTEALISIDVNSGRATREHNIEETALKTNLEAAEEVARQLRLRDMAGLVVIDFIDMEERSNNRSVERRMKEVLKSDRARIQVGRISSFGLMEMSRQRLRSNLLEVSMETCTACAGTGIVRSVESAALTALRQLEEEGIRGRSSIVRLAVCPDVAVYILNKKRKILTDFEAQYNFEIEILAQSNLGPSDIEMTREVSPEGKPALSGAVRPDSTVSEQKKPETPAEPVVTAQPEDSEEKPGRKRRRRRRRRRGGSDDTVAAPVADQSTDNTDNGEADEEAAAVADEGANDSSADDGKNAKPRRRRGSRGGRRRGERNRRERGDGTETQAVAGTDTPASDGAAPDAPTAQAEQASSEPTVSADTPATSEAATDKPRRTRRRKKVEDAEALADAADTPNDASASEETAVAEKPKRTRRPRKAASAAEEATKETASEATGEEDKPKRPRRSTKKATPAGEEEAPASEKPAPRRRRTKAADDKPAESTEKPVAADKKPKPTRRRATKKVDESTAASTDSNAGKAKDAVAPKKEKTAAEANAPAEASVSKPASAETAPQSDDQPKRKGWWQRTFG